MCSYMTVPDHLPVPMGINGGVIVKWEVSGLDGLGNELLIQKFEIAHAGVQMGDARTGGTGASFRG